MNDSVRIPVHLWIVGVLAVLWNGYGGYDYVMTQTDNAGYFDEMGFSAAQRAYFESYPASMDAAWALGVWAASPARCCC